MIFAFNVNSLFALRVIQTLLVWFYRRFFLLNFFLHGRKIWKLRVPRRRLGSSWRGQRKCSYHEHDHQRRASQEQPGYDHSGRDHTWKLFLYPQPAHLSLFSFSLSYISDPCVGLTRSNNRHHSRRFNNGLNSMPLRTIFDKGKLTHTHTHTQFFFFFAVAAVAAAPMRSLIKCCSEEVDDHMYCLACCSGGGNRSTCTRQIPDLLCKRAWLGRKRM